MFDGGSNDVQPRSALTRTLSRSERERTTDCQVVRFGATACENDAVADTRAEEFGDPVAGVFQRSAGAAAKFVLAGRVQIRLAPAGTHGFNNFREYRRRGVVVEVDPGSGAGRHRPMIPRWTVEPQKRGTPIGETAIAGGKTGPV